MTAVVRALLADIGGTNARFALVDGDGRISGLTARPAADFPSLEQAVRDYLGPVRVQRAAFAVAAPILGDQVELTNSPWGFSIDRFRREMGWERLQVVNDFVANALAVPHLGPDHLVDVGQGGDQGVMGQPIGILGPGTGLGVSILVFPPGGAPMALATEGGHVTLAAADDQDARILGFLRREMGHVSAERVLSGPGLVNLYRAVGQMEGHPLPPKDPAQITQAALAGQCPASVSALGLFFGFLGNVAGNLALTAGARGGIVLTGGILPRLVEPLRASRFRECFLDKGRFHPWLARVPTRLILHPDPAMVGLAGLVA